MIDMLRYFSHFGMSPDTFYYSFFSIEDTLEALLVWLNMMASQTFHNSQKFPQPKALVETKENFLYESTEASVAWWSYYPIIFLIDGQNLANLFQKRKGRERERFNSPKSPIKKTRFSTNPLAQLNFVTATCGFCHQLRSISAM